MLDITQTRTLEKIYLEKNDYGLMRQAAYAMYEKIAEFAKINHWKSFLIFTGSGNNGGDGYVIGELLLKNGFDKVSIIPVLPQKENISANLARKDYLSLGGLEIPYEKDLSCDCIIDAITGIGIPYTADIETPNFKVMQEYVNVINGMNTQVVSIDLPSLLCSENGLPIGGVAVRANYTLTVFTLKPGCLLGYAKDYCGEVSVVLNTLPKFKQVSESVALNGCHIRSINYSLLKPLLPQRSKCAHKGSVGRVLLVGGNKGMTGALIISALGALRTGAGLICALPISGEVLAFNSIKPEIMTAEIKDFMDKLIWASACVFGPGLGKNDGEQAFNDFYKIISTNEKSAVIDADGLFYLHEANSKFSSNNVNIIVTPHVGEAAMLCNTSVNEIISDPIAHAFKIAKTYNVICVLKSASTIVCDPFDHAYIASVGSSGMASGGMGDLLSGIIGSLLAQGYNGLTAACLGVAIHGQAGQLEEELNGAIGMCATDLLSRIRLLLNGRKG